MSDKQWHDDRIPMEYRIRAAREHNARMDELIAASEEEARRLDGLGDHVRAEQCRRDAAEFAAQKTDFGADAA